VAGFFLTRDPEALLKRFDDAVMGRRLPGWERKSLNIGEFVYTHASPQWRGKAWFKPAIQADRLAFHIFTAKRGKDLWPVYGHYHGQLLQTFLTNFRAAFQLAQTTPMPAGSDQVLIK
jgi:hypothetical protein